MERKQLKSRLCLSGIDENAALLAAEYGLGIEITAFCQASLLEDADTIALARRQTEEAPCRWFHAPFAELHPCAIDPAVRQVARQRYRRSIALAGELGIRRIVIHDGFVPTVYFPQWFTEQSVRFWKDFLQSVPEDVTIALENVMDDSPELLQQVLSAVDDPRLCCCLDIGHANVSLSAVPPMEWIAPLQPWLCHVHLHNNAGGWDLHDPLGQGTIPVENVLDTLLVRCPKADFTLENMDSRPSLQWLAEKGYL